jgi:hypothetical protein
MNGLIPFIYESIRLKESCWIDGKPCFTRRSIGEWLEYKNPDRSVHNITLRHSCVDQFSILIKLVSTDGKFYDQRVYDPIGLQLIINKSDKPKAIRFQIAVAHLVYAFMQGKLQPPKRPWNQSDPGLLQRLSEIARQLLKMPVWGTQRKPSWDTVHRFIRRQLVGEFINAQ